MQAVSRFFLVLAVAVIPAVAAAQGTRIALGATDFDPDAPVEMSADALSIDQGTGEAVFDGNVLVVQGALRLSAARIEIAYGPEADGARREIEALRASGGVTFVTASDAAEADNAVYAVGTGTVTLSGNVLLTQSGLAISGDRLVIDLNTGSGRMEGQVRTVLTRGGGN